jgi:hypothetical protein
MITMRTPRKRQAKRREITFEEFKRDRSRAIALSRRPGGLRVTDNDGKLRFFIIIPQTTISEFP